MKINSATPEIVRQVALNMRERDFAEFSAVSFVQSREELADALAERYGNRDETHVGFDGDTPVCVGMTAMARPNVITLLFFATDDFPKVGLGITRYIRKQLFPRLIAAGVHRIEAIAMADYLETRYWLQTIGLEAETGPLLGYGRNGETFIQYSWSEHARPFGT